MKKLLLFTLIGILLPINLASACVFPDKIEFSYGMNVENLKNSLNSKRMKYETINNTVILDRDNFRVAVDKERVLMSCVGPVKECMDNSDFGGVINNLEDWKAYDLSKDDKDVIASLYQPNVVIRRLERAKLFGVKLKGLFLRLLGKVLCTNYEVPVECKGSWCSLKVEKSYACVHFIEECL